MESLALLACVVLGANAFAAKLPPPVPLTKAQYDAGKVRIATEYQANLKLCGSLQGQRAKVCETEAKGRADALLAELEARFKPSPDAAQKAKNVTAQANFEAAKAKCETVKGKAKSRCVDEAKAAREAAIRQAKVEKVEETGGPFANGTAKRTPKGNDS